MNRFDPDYNPQPCDCRRLGYVPVLSHSAALAARGVDRATRCYGLFGSGDKTQSTTNTQVGASEEATQLYASGYSNVAGSDNLAGYGNKKVEGIDNTNGAFALGGVTLGGSNTGTITVNGAAGSEALADKFTDAIKSINDTAGSSVTAALEKVATLAESKQTDGASTLGRQILWGIGILVGGGVVMWIAGKAVKKS